MGDQLQARHVCIVVVVHQADVHDRDVNIRAAQDVLRFGRGGCVEHEMAGPFEVRRTGSPKERIVVGEYRLMVPPCFASSRSSLLYG